MLGPLYSKLKVHKTEILFCFDFEICSISSSVMSKKILDFAKIIFDWANIGGGTIFCIVLRLRGMKQNFELG